MTRPEYDLLKVKGNLEGTTGNPTGWIGTVVDGVPKIGASYNGTHGWYVIRVRMPIEGMTEKDLKKFVIGAHRRLKSIARAERLSKLLDGKLMGFDTERLFNTGLVDFRHGMFSIKVDSRGFLELSAVQLAGVAQLEQASRLLNRFAEEMELQAAHRKQ